MVLKDFTTANAAPDLNAESPQVLARHRPTRPRPTRPPNAAPRHLLVALTPSLNTVDLLPRHPPHHKRPHTALKAKKETGAVMKAAVDTQQGLATAAEVGNDVVAGESLLKAKQVAGLDNGVAKQALKAFNTLDTNSDGMQLLVEAAGCRTSHIVAYSFQCCFLSKKSHDQLAGAGVIDRSEFEAGFVTLLGSRWDEQCSQDIMTNSELDQEQAKLLIASSIIVTSPVISGKRSHRPGRGTACV